MSTKSLRALMAKCVDRISGIVVEKTSGLLCLHSSVGCVIEKRRPQRLPSEPESSSEFVTLVEEDRGYSSAPESDVSEDPF